MTICIYDRSAGPFDRDHVMLRAFGTFEPNSLVLDCVCQSCNNFFGRTLEFALSRESMEAVLRLRHGIKPAVEAGDLRYRKLELRVCQPGPWLGATVVLEADRTGQSVEPVLVPQVAFRWKGEPEWVWILERDFEESRLAPYRKPQPGTLDICILAPLVIDQERLIEKLKNFGVNFLKQGVLEQPITDDEGKIQLEIAAHVDDTIFRAIAKIAFNYTAWTHGADFVLRSDFDGIRNYIRYGTQPWWAPAVRPFKGPILADDMPHFRQTYGHLVTVDWNASTYGILAQVSLFNSITYYVGLCANYSGLWLGSLRSGHHFDIESREVSPLRSASFNLLPVIPRRLGVPLRFAQRRSHRPVTFSLKARTG